MFVFKNFFYSEIINRIFCIEFYDFDCFFRYDIIGEVKFFLIDVDLVGNVDEWRVLILLFFLGGLFGVSKVIWWNFSLLNLILIDKYYILN